MKLRSVASLGILTIVTGLFPFSFWKQAGPCGFDRPSLSFEGDAETQARCLLAPVGKYARLGQPLERLPDHLGQLVGQPVSVERDTVRTFLAENGLSENDIGGALDAPISETEAGLPARYFVIHDTSTPYFGNRRFPADLNNDPDVNSLRYYRHPTDAVAHVFVNRKGEIYLGHDLMVPWRGTKLERDFGGVKSRGRFVHVELVQPRRRDPRGGARNDAVAPLPGFTAVQYHRLALIYIAASIRAGIWIVPAYHAVIDGGFRGGHDDPQNFDLAAWDAAIGEILGRLED